MSCISSPEKHTVLMGRKCFLCQNTRYRSSHCRLFRFPPRGTAMWNRWLTAMGLSEEDIRPNEHPRVCQRHFDPKHFLTRQLSGMAVPVRNLERTKHSEELCAVREYSSNLVMIFDKETKTIGDFSTEYGEISDGKVSEYEVAEDVLSEEKELLQESCPSLSTGEEQSNERETSSTSTLADFSCGIPHHEELEELLSLEKARVERLLRLNAQQKQIIEDQQNLLWQLGVECVALHPDKLTDDSD